MTDIPEDVRKLAREAHAAFASSSDTRNLGDIIAAAILADREKRGEPVAWAYSHPVIGGCVRFERLPEESRSDLIEQALYASAPPSPAQPVAIKPLEWEMLYENQTMYPRTWHGVGVFKRYAIEQPFSGGPFYAVGGSHYALEDAKTAVQAVYETGIRSALVENAQPVDADAIIERCAAICDEASASWKTTAAQAYELDHNEARGWSAKAEARAETAGNLARDIRSLKGGA